MDLVEKLRLVLCDSSFDFGPHQQLVVVVEHLEHLICGAGLRQLLLEKLRELSLDLCSACFVCLLGRVPEFLTLLRGVQHVVHCLHKVGERISDVR